MSEIHVVPSESQNTINVVNGSNGSSINVVNGNTGSSVHVSNVADFYTLAKSWAISDELVENLDYSAKYYAGVSQNASNSAAQSAQMAENAKDTILTDAGFIAVKNDLENINTVAGDITNINVIAEMIINNNNLLFYEEIEQ